MRLLLCEDNEVNVLVIEAMLAPLGHRITRARDGEQAVTALRKRAGEGSFDLVLMDLHMPRKGGLEAVAELRARWPQVEDEEEEEGGEEG